MAPIRQLPTKLNPLMTEEAPTYESLVSRRRLGQTDLTVKATQVGTSNSTKPTNLGTFDYAHLRAPLPKGIHSGIFKSAPNSYFLMRRSQDGFISATGMFKATFPYAEVEDEDRERIYIKSLSTTSSDETAGNIWIPPQHALELAEEYQILPWIKALLDNRPIEANNSKDPLTPKTISPPPQFLMPQESLTAPLEATPNGGSRRSRRSVSPSKIASPRKIARGTAARKQLNSKRLRDESSEPSTENTTNGVHNSVSDIQETSSSKPSEVETKADNESEEAKEKTQDTSVVRVHVDTEVEVKGDVETTHTHVEVEMPAGLPELPLPEDTEAMIAKAKEMVEAAVKSESLVTTSGESAVVPKKNKRKANEVEIDDTEGAEAVSVSAKRAKTEATELKKERVKTRALFGISATLAIGAAVQYAFNIL